MSLCAPPMILRCTKDRTRPTVKLLFSALLVLALVLFGAPDGFAQDRSAAVPVSKTPPNMIDSLTGKERLGRKWMDEQRIDNCKIPLDKQGTKPRSSGCPHVPTG
jgi:hypothetical protein